VQVGEDQVFDFRHAFVRNSFRDKVVRGGIYRACGGGCSCKRFILRAYSVAAVAE
jgi:hypothetical protein